MAYTIRDKILLPNHCALIDAINLLLDGAYPGAIALCSGLIQRHGSRVKELFEERLQRAIDLRASGQYEAMRDQLLELAAERPDHALVQYQAARVHDRLGQETAAIPFYEKALALGLNEPEDEAGAYLGLGSTYRTLGQYEHAQRVLTAGREKFPTHRSFDVFLAMTLHNLGEHSAAMRLLLLVVADTSGDADVTAYKRAIAFYAEQVDRIWLDGEE